MQDKSSDIHKQEIIRHYDALIDENNDPARDPESLRAYMDKWDGQPFIDLMGLNAAMSILEIGVGTGRLALRAAPLCGEFCGIDLSLKTVERARENLSDFRNVSLICGDFLDYPFEKTFDVIYASLTFMHISDKRRAIQKAASLLGLNGKLVLSLDKNRAVLIDMGTRKIPIFPDDPEEMKMYIREAGFILTEQTQTEFAHILAAQKDSRCYCGHDCARCVTYHATRRNDDALREKARAFYKNEFGLDIARSKFNCLGGRSDQVFSLCQSCPFRQCCKDRGIAACNFCPEYPCKPLADYQEKYVNRCNQMDLENE